MIDKELKKTLLKHHIESANQNQIEQLKIKIINTTRPVKAPTVSISRLISSVVKIIPNLFWLSSLIFLALVIILSIVIKDETITLVLCGLTPLLSALAMPTLFIALAPERMELESTCLVKPGTTFSIKLLICGCFDLLLIIFASISSNIINSDIDILRSVLLGLLSFTASSFTTLVFSLVFKTNVGTALFSTLYVCLLSSAALSTEIINLMLNINLNILGLTLTLSVILLILVIHFVSQNLKYERIEKLHGNKVF